MIVPRSPSPNKRKSRVSEAVRKVSVRQPPVKWIKRKGIKALHAENPTLLHYIWPDFIARA